MICRVCKQNKYCLGHHISYEPEVSIPVCPDCHYSIHHGSLFFLDPVRLRVHGVAWHDSDHLINPFTGEIIDVSEYHHEIKLLMNSKYISKQQMLNVERRIELGIPTKMPYLPIYRSPPEKKITPTVEQEK